MTEEGQPLESAENRDLSAAGASATTLPAMSGAEKQFCRIHAGSKANSYPAFSASLVDCCY